MYVPNKEALFLNYRADFEELHSIHWGIECYHRAIKQVCGIELFMVLIKHLWQCPSIHNAGILNLPPQLGHSESKCNLLRSHPLVALNCHSIL
jgi:hypothetical protein